MNFKHKFKKTAGLILFSLLLVVVVFQYSNGRDKTLEEVDSINKEKERSIPVVVTSIEKRTFEERLSIQGNVEAKHFAVVPVRIPGVIEKLFVDEGDEVIAGKTRLFQIDSLKLNQAVEMSLQDLSVAQFSLKEKEANLEKVEADFEQVQRDHQRFSILLSKKVVSSDTFEQQDSRYKQITAMLKHAHTLVDLSREQEKKAVIGLEMAKKDLNDSLIYAPITGIISERYRELGEMGDKGEAVFRIDDLSVVEVSVFVPAQYYNRLFIGKTVMRVQINNNDLGEYPISFKSPTIDSKLRTFEIKCLIKNPPQGTAPGSMAEARISLDKKIAMGIPRVAIQNRKEKSVLFTVQNNRACMQEVKTGIETDGWIELKGDALSEGMPVVTMGQFLLNDGTAVTIQEETL